MWVGDGGWGVGGCSSLGSICNFTFDQLTETPTCPAQPPPPLYSCPPAFHFRHNFYLYLHMPGNCGGGGGVPSQARSQPSTWGGGGVSELGWVEQTMVGPRRQQKTKNKNKTTRS